MRIEDYIACLPASALARFATHTPWALTLAATGIVTDLIANLGPGYRADGAVAVHESATIESGAVLKPPLVIGRDCFVAAGAYLRGGCWLEAECVLGPGVEVKSSFLFAGARLAHFNFVGNSLIGAGVNVEAGAIVANMRNERPGSTVTVVDRGRLVQTGAAKFGGLIGDRSRIGANAVLSPGTLLQPGSVVPRLALIDQTDGDEL